MSEDVQSLQEMVVERLIEYFYEYTDDDAEITKANLAVKALSAVGRIKATERAKDATQLSVIKVLATDRDEYSKFIQKSLPHLHPAPAKTIKAKKKKLLKS